MKKIALVFLLLPFTGIAQKIEGIGDFKIGRTTVVDLSNITGLEDGSLREVTIESDPEDYDAPRSKGNRFFKISKYQIAGIEVENIDLQFLNDTLINFSLTYPSLEFIEAVELKYKAINTDKKTKKATCTSAAAGNYTVEDKSYTTYYRKDNLIASNYISEYYDSKCKKQMFSVFLIYDSKKLDRYRKNEDLAKANAEKKNKVDKLKALSNF